jgi:DNA-binding NarL/FixJ family response regulator
MAAELSPRQREVFAGALRGKPNKVIARELGIAEGTVKIHLAMVYRALGVKNRTEAMYRVLSADAAQAVAHL